MATLTRKTRRDTGVSRHLVRALRAVAALLCLIALLIGTSLPVAAQTEPDFQRWDGFATRVERTLDQGGATDEALTQLRDTVVDWRSRFAEAQRSQSTRVATLKDQISALGPAPAEGKTEPDDVAVRRKELEAEMAVEQAPALRASEAFGRADGLVTAIDKSLRSRQTSAVLRLTPSPLLPSSWQALLGDATRLTGGLTAEVRTRYAARGGVQGLTRALPTVLVLLGSAALILTLGWRWIGRLLTALKRHTADSARGAIEFLGSLTQVILPLVGTWAVLLAIRATGLLGGWGMPLLNAAGLATMTLFVGTWLARNLFPADPARPAILDLTQPTRDKLRRQATGLAGALALHQLISRPLLALASFGMAAEPALTIPQLFSDAGSGVVHLPLILLGAFPLYRLGHLLRRPAKNNTSTGERVISILGTLAKLVAIAAPVAAVAGYVSAANAVLWPSVTTLALVGAIVLLQRFLTDLWVMVRRNPDAGRDTLAPVLIGFVLLIAALPVLALIWGARPSDLVEAWTRIGQGVRIGSVRLSPAGILSFVLVFSLGYTITRALQGTLRNSVLPRTKIDKGGQTALVSGLGYVGIFIAAMLSIGAAGIDLSSLAIVAGALSVGIGFGLQNIVSNFVSGIILLIERPVTVGDWIQVGTAQGTVRKISVRSTTIQTFDRTDVVVPNSDLITQHVTNWTRGSLTGRIIVPVSVAYGIDTRKLEGLLIDIAENQPTVLIDPKPQAVFVGFGTDGLNFEVRAILSDINQGLSVSSEIRHEIVERLAEAGINMPFAQRDIWLRNPEALAQAVVPTARDTATGKQKDTSTQGDADHSTPQGGGVKAGQ